MVVPLVMVFAAAAGESNREHRHRGVDDKLFHNVLSFLGTVL